MAGGGIAELKEKVARLEEIIGAPQEDESISLAARVELQEADLRSIQESMGDRLKSHVEQMDTLRGDLVSMVDKVTESVTRLEMEVSLVKLAVAKVSKSGEGTNPKIRVPEPIPFKGARNAKELENFLWDMEQYFQAAHIPEHEQVTMTSMYLAGDAKLWWRTRVQDDVNAGRQRIETWSALKKELKIQFLPLNASWLARDALKKLRHTDTVRSYVTEFSSLMLDIHNMSEEDKLFNFISGLQPWAQVELNRLGVKELASAIATADSLVDYGPPLDNETRARSEDRGSKAGKLQFSVTGQKSSGTQLGSKGMEPEKMAKQGCFICDGPHRARECPKRQQLNAFVAEPSEGDDDSESQVARVGALTIT